MQFIKALGVALGYIVNGVILVCGLLLSIVSFMRGNGVFFSFAALFTVCYGLWCVYLLKGNRREEERENGQVVSPYEKLVRRLKHKGGK